MENHEKETQNALRCVGHCCKRFALTQSPEELQASYQRSLQDPSQEDPDIQMIAQMVILVRQDPKGREYLYTCKNLGSNGDCRIYENRPQMCRDFPSVEGCHFLRCKSSQSAYFGLPWYRKFLKRFRWISSLDGP